MLFTLSSKTISKNLKNKITEKLGQSFVDNNLITQKELNEFLDKENINTNDEVKDIEITNREDLVVSLNRLGILPKSLNITENSTDKLNKFLGNYSYNKRAITWRDMPVKRGRK